MPRPKPKYTGPERRSGKERRTGQERRHSTPPHAKERVEWFTLPGMLRQKVFKKLKKPKPAENYPGEFSERRSGEDRRKKP